VTLEETGPRSISSRWLLVFLFALVLISGSWIGTVYRSPLIALCLIGFAITAHLHEFPIAVPREPRPALRAGDWIRTGIAAAPVFFYLIVTWSQEFPHGGDQVYHNGASLEAHAFWWWLPWVLAVAGLLLAIRFPPLALPLLIVLMCVAMLPDWPRAFAGRYPGTLHFFAVPLRALPFRSPLNVERLINTLAVPSWLLVLRPLILRRPVGIGAFAAALFLFWQKDVVYYFTTGYLEPWAIVLLLTAGEHLVRFGSEMIWRPLLLLGAAAMVKEQAVLSFPVVAAMDFPFRASWRERVRYLLVAASAIAPVLLFLFARRSFREWDPAYPTMDAFRAAHVAAFAQRIWLEFGVSLPLILIAVALLVILALRRRAFATLLFAALLTWLVFFTASVLQTWPGYPRGNLVPLAYAAIAVSFGVEWLAARSGTAAWAAIVLIAVLHGIVLAPFLRDTMRPDSTRNFIEHSDAAIFLPVRESMQRAEAAGLLSPGGTVSLLNNGKWTYPFFYPGPVQEQVPDLSRRYRLLVKSYAYGDNWQRCRCAAGETTIAFFIRFQNLGTMSPALASMQAEGERCKQQMLASCRRTLPIEHEGFLVALAGSN